MQTVCTAFNDDFAIVHNNSKQALWDGVGVQMYPNLGGAETDNAIHFIQYLILSSDMLFNLS